MDNYEVIFVDDGSTDSSAAILNRYQKQFPDLIRTISVSNGGQGRARNIALKEAKGEYIGFVDSDDYVAPDMYQKLFKAIEGEHAEIAACGVMRVEGEKLTHEVFHNGVNPLSAAGAVWDKLFCRTLIEDIQFPEGLWYEDFSFSAIALMKARKVAFISDPLYYYRCGHTSTMKNQNSKKNLDLIPVMENIREFGENSGLQTSEEFEKLILDHLIIDAINRVSNHRTQEKKTVIHELRMYAKKNIPSLSTCKAFPKEPFPRKLVIWLNYNGMERMSRCLLNLNQLLHL